jgi:hypothetical protein
MANTNNRQNQRVNNWLAERKLVRSLAHNRPLIGHVDAGSDASMKVIRPRQSNRRIIAISRTQSGHAASYQTMSVGTEPAISI